MADRVSGGNRVAGKVALVTGAAVGLGAATARRLAAEGAAVMLTDRNVEDGSALAAEIVAAGGRAAFLRHDVTIPAEWEAAVAATLAAFGRLDVLVNNAGIAIPGTELMSHSLEAWRQIMAVNLDGVFYGMRFAGPAIAASGGVLGGENGDLQCNPRGSIINLSSILGKVGMAGQTAYCASKGGVALLSKAAALEWAPLGIRVNSVHPGFIETPMVQNALRETENGNEVRDQLITAHALGRLGQPREIADAIVFLASDESSFMTGSEVVVDGGYTAH